MTNLQGEQGNQPRAVRSIVPLRKELVDQVLGTSEPLQPLAPESSEPKPTGGEILASILDGISRTLLGAVLGVIGMLIYHAFHAGLRSLMGRPNHMPLEVAVLIGVVVGSIGIWRRPRVR
jgi:hypothetical protein